MSFSEDSKEDILALALSNAATDTNAANESSTGLLDFLNMDSAVDNTILPVHPLAVTSAVDAMITAPVPSVAPMPHEDNLMDMLGLTDDKLDTISNNELDSLLEEASKIEVPKEVEMALNSPSVVDSSREFKLPQQDVKLSQVSSLLLKPLPNATRPIAIHPVTTNMPKSVTAVSAASNKMITASSIAPNTSNKAITVTSSTTSSVASKFSVTEAFKVLGTTGKPVVNLKGQQLINLLNTSLVNTTIVSSSSLNIPVLSLPSTSRPASTTVTTIDRRYCDIIICLL